MKPYWQRVVDGEDGLAIGSNGTLMDSVLLHLQEGESPATVAEWFEIDRLDVVASIAHAALGEVIEEGPDLERRDPRFPLLITAVGEKAIAGLFPEWHRAAQLSLCAGLALMHDFWETSHRFAQESEDLGEKITSAYWHGIAHRREPDEFNAAYWMKRVGKHKIHPDLATRAALLLGADRPQIASKLIPGEAWDPLAFIHFCNEAEGDDRRLALELQRVEMILLLDVTLDPPGMLGNRNWLTS
ncbi:MAG: hypothetical protein U0794_14560 [Isosphaeraceae bacterium]